MKPYKNILITGAKNSGKSTLANWFLDLLDCKYAGFRTVQAFETDAGPLYEMEDILSGQKQLISAYVNERIRGIESAFEEFGVLLLENALQSDAPVILTDEIGRFERHCTRFLEQVQKIADSEKLGILLLKKEDLPHIQKMKEREDSLLIDLDEISREEARELLKHILAKKEDVL